MGPVGASLSRRHGNRQLNGPAPAHQQPGKFSQRMFSRKRSLGMAMGQGLKGAKPSCFSEGLWVQ